MLQLYSLYILYAFFALFLLIYIALSAFWARKYWLLFTFIFIALCICNEAYYAQIGSIKFFICGFVEAVVFLLSTIIILL